MALLLSILAGPLNLQALRKINGFGGNHRLPRKLRLWTLA